MLNAQIPLLKADDIEVRIQQACRGNKALALLYKTSRTDMRILDEVFGIDGWKCDYKEIRNNLYCGISIYDSDKKEWITKWDCGIESQQADGNEKKAEASDAFKRAGTKLGIGRELYTSPQIYLSAETKENTNGKFKLVNSYEKYSVLDIDYSEKKEITKLVIVDSKGNVVYSFGSDKKPIEQKNSGVVPKKSNKEKLKELMKTTGIKPNEIAEIIKSSFGEGLKADDLTDKQFDKLCGLIKKYVSGEGNQ